MKIVINELNRKIGTIPEKTGFFICSDDRMPLFFKTTENLKKFISLYLMDDTEDQNLINLREETRILEFVPCEDLFEAFVEELLFTDHYQPPFNKILKAWTNYTYLSVQWNFVPFVRISDNTLENAAYIGPFRDHFYLYDLIDTFSTLYKLPACKDEDFPCDLKDNGTCAGYCIYDKHTDTAKILMSFYLLPNIHILNDLENRLKQLNDQLRFEDYEQLKTQSDLIKKYYRQLLFLYTTRFLKKDIYLQDYLVEIDNGMIKSLKKDNKTVYINQTEDYPRDNELLCINKHETDHRWIIFRFLEKTDPKLINQLFNENYKEIQMQIFNAVNIENQ